MSGYELDKEATRRIIVVITSTGRHLPSATAASAISFHMASLGVFFFCPYVVDWHVCVCAHTGPSDRGPCWSFDHDEVGASRYRGLAPCTCCTILACILQVAFDIDPRPCLSTG